MTKKGNLIYKIITMITLAVPLPIYLFLSATLFNIVPDYTINAKIDTISVFHLEDEYFITTSDKTATMIGVVSYNEHGYGIYIDSDDIIKIDKNYYSYVEQDGVFELRDIKKFEVQKQTSYKLPLTFFISVIGVLMVVLIVQGKMSLHKKYPRIATLISLLSFTILMFVINTIISNILNVFIIATVSWAVYCLEFMVVKGKIDGKKAEKQESDLIGTLKNMLKGN